MKSKVILLLLFISCLACTTVDEIPFDKEKWMLKEGKDYLYRNQMVNAIVYNDTIRTLNKKQLLTLLDTPSYTREGHMYYRITENRLGNWTLHTKTMVVKLLEDESIDWIKIHE